MKKLFFILAFCAGLESRACEVTLPHQLVILNPQETQTSPLRSNGCGPALLKDLFQTLAGLQGRINSFQLLEIMAGKGHTLKVSPQVLHVQQLKNIIREQLPLPAGVQVKEIKISDLGSTLDLSTGDRVELICDQCHYGQDQLLSLNVLGFAGDERNFQVKVDFRKMVKSYRLTAPLNSFADVTAHGLKEEYVESIPHTDLVTDLSTLRFYKTNKPLKSGDLLRLSDLNAVNLVRAGLQIEVILENELIKVKTNGISRNNGALGDTVEVFQPQKNKKYQGRVIDVNKVLVEL
ncbi:MAG TPA: flagellar basal body P-ring formation chaperone FlgA [Bacteriovoracaceae bacterium]|nr:flagellar basal body P-ring formation chaperone FlgA [Bacteriovoracaceae bacterium]